MTNWGEKVKRTAGTGTNVPKPLTIRRTVFQQFAELRWKFCGNPAFKMVLTGTGEYAYRRKDGVLVVPVGCLRD